MKSKCFLLILVSINVHCVNAHEANNVPSLRGLVAAILPRMEYAVSQATAGTCSLLSLVSAGDVYFSPIQLQTSCALHFTFQDPIQDSSSTYNLPVPHFVKGKKILLTPYILTATVGEVEMKYYSWTCRTNVDDGYKQVFQGVSSIAEGEASIISYFEDNLYTGNCIYDATPF